VGVAVNSWQLLPAIRDLFSERPEYWHHGALHLACSEAVRRGLAEVVLRFAHPRSSGDPAGKMSCRSGCFAVNESTAEEGRRERRSRRVHGGANHGRPALPKRTGPKGLLPSTWLERTLRVAYTHCYGSGQETSGTLLDLYPVGPVLNVSGVKTVICWERPVLCELVED
jgi:hypothetical protein